MTNPTRARRTSRRHLVLAPLAATAVSASLLLGAPAADAHRGRPSHDTPSATSALPLGPSTLAESRTTETLQPGVTHTTIVRGSRDGSLGWVVEVSIPAGTTSPDPDAPPRSVQDRAAAEATASRLDAAGWPATAQPVHQPAVADVAAGVIGHRVRLDQTFASKAEADAASTRVKAAGFGGRAWYQGWDGEDPSAGPWTVHLLTIDPRDFTGTLGATYGPDLEHREKTTVLAALTGARAAVNAGFFVMDPAAGAEGDPAGAASYDGVFESEPVAGRPVLVLREDARHTRVVRPEWRGEVRAGGERLALDGYNRVPGLIRNCGGDATDLPTSRAVHDATCTDASELVAFTPAFGARTPAGPGVEVVLQGGRVVAVHQQRGTALNAGQTSLQATGGRVPELSEVYPGQRVRVQARLVAAGGSLTNPRTTVVNGGPQLVRAGREFVTQDRDGMHQAASNPSFDYGWVLQRNPRTFAGRDAQGRTLLVTVDGRQVDQLGLSIPETARVARSLGMVEAINLDGGGSTAMAIDQQLVTSPSDAAGERPVGDAIVVR